jgi:hypothetical protein
MSNLPFQFVKTINIQNVNVLLGNTIITKLRSDYLLKYLYIDNDLKIALFETPKQ